MNIRRNALVAAALILAGVGIILFKDTGQVQQYFKTFLNARNVLYSSQDQQLVNRFHASQIKKVGWSDLLPDEDKQVLKQYTAQPSAPLHEQVFQSIQASWDASYQQVMRSTSTVEAMDGVAVTLSGFIVPVEVDEQRSVTAFFLVPYFGACLHFPAPAPNQMVYVRLTGTLEAMAIDHAYSVSGFLTRGLFEDPLGTSAYLLDALEIVPFAGQPDDVRQHQDY